MNEEDVIRIVVMVVFWLGWTFLKSAGKGAATKTVQAKPRTPAAPKQEIPGRVASAGAGTGVVPTELIEAIDGELQKLRDDARGFRGRVRGAGQAGGALADAVRETVEEPTESVDVTWRAVRNTLREGKAVPQLREHVSRTSQWIAVIRGRLNVLGELADQRSSEDLGEMLDDADAIAQAFVSPFGSFARTHNIDFPMQDPISVPANGQGEAVLLGLLPNRPIIQVPSNFGTDIYRWMAVPHEIAHVIWHRTPGLEIEVRSKLGLHDSAELMRRSEPVQELPRRLMSSWLLEFFADWVAVMLTGPAAVHGLSFVFDQSASPARAGTVWVTQQGEYDEHPPAHLRMLSACALLRRMGYIVQADALEAEWRERHPMDQVVVPLAGGDRVPFGADDLANFVNAYAVAFYETEFESLSGRTFSSIPGFEMTFGMWARVQRDAAKLGSRKSFHDDPRYVICGAVEARWHHPDDAEEIRLATRAAIIGEHAPLSERSHRRRERIGGVTQKGRFSRAEFRDALILKGLIEPRVSAPARKSKRVESGTDGRRPERP
ncbi:MAG: hypothetical protein ACJAYU_005103 [Bradymonadia bacterium]|jgi:hypothetical protein